MRVEAIFISPNAAESTEAYSVDQSQTIAGLGLEGDRYAKYEGHWQKIYGIDSKVRDVSFITLSGLSKAAKRLGWTDDPVELARLSRRNILLDDGDLTELQNTIFRIGDSVMFGMGDCDPCTRPNEFADGRLPRFSSKKGLQSMDGLRARVSHSGLISVGDEVRIFYDNND